MESVNMFLDLSFSTGMDADVKQQRLLPREDEETSTHSSSSTGLSMGNDEEEDDMASLEDGRIPTMAAFYAEEEEEEPCIVYLGREYKICDFQHSAKVWNQSRIGQPAPPRGIRSSRTTTPSTTTPTPTTTTTAGMSQSEYWGITRSRLASVTTISETVSSAGQATYRRASALLRRAQTQTYANDTTAAATTTTTTTIPKRRVSCQSEYFGSTRRASTTTTNTIAAALPNHSEYTSGSSRRPTVTATSLLSKWTSRNCQQEEWERIVTQKWGYTNQDVLRVVENDRIFAKLQHDLRCVSAITNSIVQQRIHIFVHNTRSQQHVLATPIGV